MKSHLLAAFVLSLAAGCATPEASTEPAKQQGEYRTGSNIPRKAGSGDRVETMSPQDLERARLGQQVPAGR